MAESLNNEIRVVLLGKTGAGKSTLGNNLLGQRIFPAATAGSSLTSNCKVGDRLLRDGKKLVIVDTPGLFDTRKSNQETSIEICRCVGLSSPGPHVFLFVLRVGRFTPEEAETIDHLCNLFGEHVMKHVVVVFTEKDSLDYENKSLDTYVSEAPAILKQILRNCGSRYVAVNNRAKNIDEEMTRVMSMVQKTITSRGGAHYTGEMYQAAEKALKERMKQIEQEKKREEEDLQRRKQELERREREMNDKTNKQIRDLEQQIEDIRNSNPRQEVRQEVEKKPGLAMTILKGIGSIALTAVTAVAASRCSLM